VKTKLDLVLENIASLDLTAYEIGKGTGLNVAGIQKIIDGKSEKPRETTLNLILHFIEVKKKEGSAIPGHKNYDEKTAAEIKQISEPKEDYKTSIELLQEKIQSIRYIYYLENLLKENNIPFKKEEI